jgi:hypothetical protein
MDDTFKELPGPGFWSSACDLTHSRFTCPQSVGLVTSKVDGRGWPLGGELRRCDNAVDLSWGLGLTLSLISYGDHIHTSPHSMASTLVQLRKVSP